MRGCYRERPSTICIVTFLSSTRGRLALALASGILQAVAHARIELAVGTVLASAALAVAVDGASARIGAACGLVFGVVVCLGFAPQAAAGWMIAVALLCFGLLCALMGLVGALCTGTGRSPWLAALGLPAVAWIYETLNGLGPMGDYLGLAAATVGLPVVGLARWGGPGASAAAAVGIGVAVAYLWSAERRRTMGITLVFWLLATAGAASPPSGGQELVVGAIVHRPASSPAAILADLTEGTRTAAAQGARLVVWPEAALQVQGPPSSGEHIWQGVSAAAREAGVPLVAGAFVRELNENLAVLVAADGAFVASYSKNRLIPAMERYTPGASPPEPWTVPGIPVALGAVICFDDCFASGTQRLAREGAGLLVVPTNDWPRVQHRHRRLSMLRAAQAGLPLVRAASGGFSQIVSARGNIVAQAAAPTTDIVVLVAPVQVAR